MEKIAKKLLLAISEFDSNKITLVKLYKSELYDKIRLLMLLYCYDIETAKKYLEINDALKIEDITYVDLLEHKYILCNVNIFREDFIKYEKYRKAELYECAVYLSKELNIQHIILNLSNRYRYES
jgi:hypothetical protein